MRIVSLLLIIVLFAGQVGCAMNGNGPKHRDDTSHRAEDAPETFVYFIHPTREGFIDSPTDRESELVGAHFQYLKALTAQGVVLLAGPSTDPPYTGIVIFTAPDRGEAQQIMDRDPAVANGVFAARLSAFRMALCGDLAGG